MRLSLKVLRASKNLTQEECGQLVGVSRVVWHNWETKKSKPNAEQIKKILNAFNVSFEDIFF